MRIKWSEPVSLTDGGDKNIVTGSTEVGYFMIIRTKDGDYVSPSLPWGSPNTSDQELFKSLDEAKESIQAEYDSRLLRELWPS